MSMVVKNNIPAVYGLGTLNRNSTALSKSLEKVSTGMKINSAADDNSAWSISERMRVRIRGLDQADQNTQNGRSLLKVAEGAVQSTVDILKTLKEKAINAANDTNTDADRQTIQKELNQSIDQIDDNANVTYNGKILMDGSKNTIGSATYTALTNQSLAKDTQTGTALTDLKDRNGGSLGIVSTDTVTVSYVQNGKTYTSSFTVGTACLHDIFVSAEAADPTSQTFADQTNSSVGAAAGLGTPEELQQLRTQLYNAWQQAEADLTTAQNAVDAQQTTVDNARSALSNAQSTVNTLTGLQTAMVNAYNTMSSNVTNNTDSATWEDSYGSTTSSSAVAIKAGFNDWVSNGTASGIATYPSPSNLGSTGAPQYHFYYVANAQWASGYSPTSSITNIVNSYNAYSSAYTAFSNAGGDTALSDAQTALSNAQSTLATETATLGSLQSTLAQKKSDVVTARNNYNSIFGPYLLTGEKLGTDRSGNMVTTATGENAITVTANTSGINGQISGFSVRITDSEGNVKTAANAALDAFSETIRAENASEDNALTLHVGADPGVAINLGMTDMRSEALGLKGSDGTKLDISTQERANAAISVLDNAIQKALNQQADIGNIASRLEYTSANLRVASDNVQASESTIRDADMAKEMTAYTKNNVLLSASQSMLSQANQNSMNVMTLLQ